MRRPAPSFAVMTASLLLTACFASEEAAHAVATNLDGASTPLSPLDSLVASGEDLYYEGEYDAARAVWLDARAHAATDEPALEPHIVMWLGLAAWKQSDYDSARRLGEESLALKLERGLVGELSRSYNSLGLVAWHEGRLADAAELFTSAQETARAVDDEVGIERAIGNLGLVQADLGHFTAAAASFRAVHAAARSRGDVRMQGNAMTNLGMVLVRQGAPRAALDALRAARVAYDSLDYAAGHQNALGQMATAYAELGEPRRALAALDSALAIARAQGLREDETSNLLLIGQQYASIGNVDRALRFFGDARRLAIEAGLELHAATAARSEAAAFARLGHLQRARESAELALAAHQKRSARFEVLQDLQLLVEIEQASGNLEAAEAYLAAARKLADELDSGSAQVSAALTEAHFAERTGDPRRVLSALTADSALLSTLGAANEAEVFALRARAHTRLQQTGEAVAAGRAALRAVERVRGRLHSGELRSLYTADRSQVYADLTVNLLRLGEVEEAFRVADAARGRGMLEHLAAAEIGATQSATLRDLAEGERLLRHIDELVAQLAAYEELPTGERGVNSAANAALAQRLAEARAEYELLLVRAARHGARDAALLALPLNAGVDEVHASLQPGELLVQYLVTAERLLVFVVTPHDIRTLESPVGETDLTNRIRLARDLLSRPGADPQEAAPVLTALHELLIAPLRRAGLLENTGRLIIVPHQALAYLPFAALRDGVSGRYLVEDVALVHLPSAASLPVLRAVTRESAAAAPRASAFAPQPRMLPATRAEALQLRTYAPFARVRVGARASELELRRALQRGDLVHVASHGIMNSGNPMFSRISLAPGRPSRPEDNGRLEVHEVLGLPIRSPLVFLSGCETGVGGGWHTDYARREDFATLAQAFLFAGAQSVVATLWPIEDAGAAVLAGAFYRHLRGADPAGALGQAQRELLRHERYAHPYYWAGYTVHGAQGPR